MECMHCRAQWTLREGQTKLANCPFCGKTLTMEETKEKYTDLAEALSAIAKMRGIDYLMKNPQNVLGIFLDITKNLQKEYRLLKLFYDNGTEKFFEDSAQVTEGQLGMAVRSLREKAFMEEGPARHIVNIFADVLGIKVKVQEQAAEILSGGQSVSQGSVVKETIEEKKEGEETKSPSSEEMIAAIDLEIGDVIEMDQELYEVIEVRKPSAFGRVGTTLRLLRKIDIWGITRGYPGPTEKCRKVRIERKEMTYLDSKKYLYSKTGCPMIKKPFGSYEIVDLSDEQVCRIVGFSLPDDMVSVYFYKGNVLCIEFPFLVERKVIRTWVKHMYYGGEEKYAVLENIEAVKVPLSVKDGDIIRIRNWHRDVAP